MILVSLRAAFDELCDWLESEAQLRAEEPNLTIAEQFGYLMAAQQVVAQLMNGCGDLGLFAEDEGEGAQP